MSSNNSFDAFIPILENDSQSELFENIFECTINNTNNEFNISEVHALLASWGFNEIIIKKISDAKLSLWHLSVIEDSDIDVLFPLSELADRVKFKACLKGWRQGNSHSRASTPSCTSSTSTSSVVNSEEEGGPIKDTYYVPRKLGGHPKGKLYDRVRNSKHTLTKKGLIKNNKSQSAAAQAPNTQPSTHLHLNNKQVTEDDKEIKAWLKYNKEDDDWENIFKKWQSTSHLRVQECQRRVFTEILEDWPLYKHATKGHILIDCDFEQIFPGRLNKLFYKWQNFVKAALEIYPSAIKDKKGIEQLTAIRRDSVNEDYKNYKLIELLHCILKPSCRIKKVDKNIWKPSIVDSQFSQVQVIASVGDLQRKIAERNEKYHKVGLKVQPFIILIQNDGINFEYYVWVESMIHKFETFLKALDYCFKNFHCFNFQYPKECELVWTFIQKFFFEIDAEYDINCPQLSTIIATFKNFEK
ncbi:uncharacterized protein LOC116176660 isoform X2 [Photinus pyralis]|uniref:SAM domain-containing protein n=1 Tax=Photinus pyralis TaxID=7054 RepID=A0A1Y1MX69_PHOPY|nr:uncharacterized protein LOC116176660 isoform X2 [Photinus pyralis]